MNVFKTLIFLITLPIMGPIMLFLHFTHGMSDEKDWAWYQKSRHGKNGFVSKIFATMLAPLYFILRGLLELIYEPWTKLIDG